MIWKITLADDWQRLHRRGTVIVSGAFGLVSAFGPVLRDAWRSMPDDLKTVIPAHVQQAIAYAILFATIIGARYNICVGAFGSSTLLRLLNSGDRAGAAAQFAVWNKSGGVVVSGLAARRKRETDLFLTGTSSKS
ncbi:glycoside hydrolase family protein [Paraburkholderia bannensis]|uniref:glycoside hydrolase family protein n=1 Tax=Paraburkholderia bannensis TaxID=765414 RepID=UPI002AC33FE9|nr:glycoside hydrolase family protein [Paraburkholderia bannensis]